MEPGPKSFISAPLTCDLSLKCQRVYAKFNSIQNKLDVYWHEMTLHDRYYKERIKDLKEMKEKIKRAMEEIKRDIDGIYKRQSSTPTDSSSVPGRSPSSTYGLLRRPNAVNSVENSERKSGGRGSYGLTGGGVVGKHAVGATSKKDPIIGVTTTAAKSPSYVEATANKSQNIVSKPYRPVSPRLYEVSSQLGKYIAETNRNR